jgi:hypothetical protein
MMHAATPHLSEFPIRARRHLHGVVPMTSRSTYPVCAAVDAVHRWLR